MGPTTGRSYPTHQSVAEAETARSRLICPVCTCLTMKL